MTSTLTCHACVTEHVVARGVVALNMTPEKLVKIGKKLGWEIGWWNGKMGECLCPNCVVRSDEEFFNRTQ